MLNQSHFRMAAVALAIVAAPGVAVATHTDPDMIPIDVIPGEIPQGDIRIGLQDVAYGLTSPVFGAFAPGDKKHLYVTDQPGILWKIELSNGDKRVFLDASGLLVPLGVFGGESFDERGLLGVAFHPDYRSNGRLYTFTSEPALASTPDFSTIPAGKSPNHEAVIREWTVPKPNDPGAVVDPGTTRVLMRIDEPQFNHNSGAISFDTDGMLRINVGDGGGADDQPDADAQGFIAGPPFTPVTMIGHGVIGNGQNPGNVLGSVLRIDPDGDSSPNGQYGIPEDNPFFVEGSYGGETGCADGLCDEIYAYGFRNIFRGSIDEKTGLMFVGDVGQNDIEEIDIVVRAGNYGWKLKEGSFQFDHNGAADGLPTKDSPNVPPGMIDPVAQYDHDEGVSVIGGFVYRGKGVKKLEGRYVFGEFSDVQFDPTLEQCNGRLFFLEHKFDKPKKGKKGSKERSTEEAVIANDLDGKMREFKLKHGDGTLGSCLLGFGQDANGEVYVLTNERGVPFGATGRVRKIVK